MNSTVLLKKDLTSELSSSLPIMIFLGLVSISVSIPLVLSNTTRIASDDLSSISHIHGIAMSFRGCPQLKSFSSIINLLFTKVHQERAEAPHQSAACARWYSRKGDEAERQYQDSALLGQQ
jgi:hypothetical protein